MEKDSNRPRNSSTMKLELLTLFVSGDISRPKTMTTGIRASYVKTDGTEAIRQPSTRRYRRQSADEAVRLEPNPCD